MRLIHKSPEPNEFKRWKQANPTATFDNLGNVSNRTLKQAVKASLLAEQKYICCYCENRIDAQTSHIEHLHPQTNYPQKQLDYSNLLASCEAGGKKTHCGHKKDRQLLPITPLDPIEPSQHFIFAADGNIYPRHKNNNAADTTIKILGLDAKRLVTMRSTVISTIIALLINSPEERQQTLDTVSPSSDKLYEFYSTIRYQLDQLTTLPAQ
jgi:uncharacterized protein (TIGR02646 family)